MTTSKKKPLFIGLIVGILLVLTGVLLFSGKGKESENTDTGTLTYTVYPVEEGWGYDIYNEERRVIHQPFIPAISGEQVFPDEETAVKTARLVIQKMITDGSPSLKVEEVTRILEE